MPERREGEAEVVPARIDFAIRPELLYQNLAWVVPMSVIGEVGQQGRGPLRAEACNDRFTTDGPQAPQHFNPPLFGHGSLQAGNRTRYLPVRRHLPFILPLAPLVLVRPLIFHFSLFTFSL